MKNNLKILFFILTSTIYSQLIKPANGSQLNYIHVLFEWEQINDALSYNFMLDDDVNFNSPILNFNTYSLAYIEDELKKIEILSKKNVNFGNFII